MQRAPNDPVQPADVLARTHEELRGCGFSGMKVCILPWGSSAASDISVTMTMLSQLF